MVTNGSGTKFRQAGRGLIQHRFIQRAHSLLPNQKLDAIELRESAAELTFVSVKRPPSLLSL
jgi:hypothetical protein